MGRGWGKRKAKTGPICCAPAHLVTTATRCLRPPSSNKAHELRARKGGVEKDRRATPSHLFFLPCSVVLGVLFFVFLLQIQPLCGPVRGLPPPPTSLLVTVTRQTFLVVTAGLVELGSSTGMVFKKRVSQTTATLNSNAAGRRGRLARAGRSSGWVSAHGAGGGRAKPRGPQG